MELKEAKLEDLPELAEAFMQAFNNAGVGENWSQKSATEFLKPYMDNGNSLFIVAIENSTIIGGLAGHVVTFWDGKYVRDTALFILPSFQSKGVGKKLLRHFLVIAKEEYEAIVFEGEADGKFNEFPLNWYKKIGMQPSGWVHISGSIDEMIENLDK